MHTSTTRSVTDERLTTVPDTPGILPRRAMGLVSDRLRPAAHTLTPSDHTQVMSWHRSLIQYITYSALLWQDPPCATNAHYLSDVSSLATRCLPPGSAERFQRCHPPTERTLSDSVPCGATECIPHYRTRHIDLKYDRR